MIEQSNDRRTKGSTVTSHETDPQQNSNIALKSPSHFFQIKNTSVFLSNDPQTEVLCLLRNAQKFITSIARGEIL